MDVCDVCDVRGAVPGRGSSEVAASLKRLERHSVSLPTLSSPVAACVFVCVCGAFSKQLTGPPPPAPTWRDGRSGVVAQTNRPAAPGTNGG